MTFSEVYEKYLPHIEVAALSQYVIGHDYDDIVSEMLGCLWKAWKTYDAEKGSFAASWWPLWLTRRRDINRDAKAEKRPLMYDLWHELGDDLLDAAISARMPTTIKHLPVPTTDDKKRRMVWVLIAAGFTPSDIMEATGMSRRAYYGIINAWRTPEIKSLLSGGTDS